MNVEKFSNFFFGLEKDLDLTNWRIATQSGIELQVWPALRFELFKSYSEAAGIYQWTSTTKTNSAKSASKSKFVFPHVVSTNEFLIQLGLPTASSNRFKPRKFKSKVKNLFELPYLVLPFARRQADGGEKFTDFLRRDLKGELGVIAADSKDAKLGSPSFQSLRKYAIKAFGSKFSTELNEAISESDRELFHNIISRTEKYLELELEQFQTFPVKFLSEFLAEYHLWDRFFKKAKTKKLFLPISQFPMIGAARANGVKVIEIQHGLFNPYPMRFNWPGNPVIDYAPDEIWVWGSFWVQGFELPAGQQVKLLGMNDWLKGALTKTYNKVLNQITFSSQPAVFEQLLKAATELAQRRSDLNVVFRNHPGDSYEVAKQRIEEANLSNLSLSNPSMDILDLLGESAVVVGAFSTTLVESVALGTPVVMLYTAAWTRLAKLVELGDAILVESEAEIEPALAKAKVVTPQDYFYAKQAAARELL